MSRTTPKAMDEWSGEELRPYVGLWLHLLEWTPISIDIEVTDHLLTPRSLWWTLHNFLSHVSSLYPATLKPPIAGVHQRNMHAIKILWHRPDFSLTCDTACNMHEFLFCIVVKLIICVDWCCMHNVWVFMPQLFATCHRIFMAHKPIYAAYSTSQPKQLIWQQSKTGTHKCYIQYHT
jgi:hypothetical protein